MSFIRLGQEGSYIDIPGGSWYYLYDNGTDIEGWDPDEFAGIIFSVAEEVVEDDEYLENIRDAFVDYFGGIRTPEQGGIARPERAEIFCQCLDRRFDNVELRESLHATIREEFTAEIGECRYCEDEVRADTSLSKKLLCRAEDCEDKAWAEGYNIDVEDYREIKDLDQKEFKKAIDELHADTSEEKNT